MSEPTKTATKPIKIPGPDHPITIERSRKRVTASLGGAVLADSHDARILRDLRFLRRIVLGQKMSCARVRMRIAA